jgi:antibiotic biosynthesis monooxygenase (ABM) superfamily enzyme
VETNAERIDISQEERLNRRGIIKSAFAASAVALGLGRFATPAAAQTKHIRLYVEMDVAPAREKEMLDTFHNSFVPEAVKHEGYIRVKMLKRRSFIQGTAPANHNYRFELEFESEESRQKWIASPGHQRVWPLVEKTMTTQKNYPVVLYDEV